MGEIVQAGSQESEMPKQDLFLYEMSNVDTYIDTGIWATITKKQLLERLANDRDVCQFLEFNAHFPERVYCTTITKDGSLCKIEKKRRQEPLSAEEWAEFIKAKARARVVSRKGGFLKNEKEKHRQNPFLLRQDAWFLFMGQEAAKKNDFLVRVLKDFFQGGITMEEMQETFDFLHRFYEKNENFILFDVEAPEKESDIASFLFVLEKGKDDNKYRLTQFVPMEKNLDHLFFGTSSKKGEIVAELKKKYKMT